MYSHFEKADLSSRKSFIDQRFINFMSNEYFLVSYWENMEIFLYLTRKSIYKKRCTQSILLYFETGDLFYSNRIWSCIAIYYVLSVGFFFFENTHVCLLKINTFKLYIFLIFFKFIHFWEGAEEQRHTHTHTHTHTQNPKQAPGSELSSQSPMWGSNSQTTRSWPELKSDA